MESLDDLQGRTIIVLFFLCIFKWGGRSGGTDKSPDFGDVIID